MEFRILGPLEVVDRGRAVALGGAKQRALLALLLLHVNEVVSSERLLDDLWDGHPPAAGRTALRVRISQLRKAIGADVVATRAPGYVLRAGPDDVDLAQFERLVAEAEDAGPAVAAVRLREALALWRGSPLADVAYEPWAQTAIARLDELRLVALEQRIDADLALGRHEALVPELAELVAAHPLRERLCARLMVALYHSGRQAEALEAYREARRTLVEELGLEPTLALQELERSILTHDPVLAPGAPTAAEARSILLAPATEAGLVTMLALLEPLARNEGRELILARVVGAAELVSASEQLARHRDALIERGAQTRVAAFTSREPAADLARLASAHAVDLVLVEGDLAAARTMLEHAPCDVALLPAPRDAPPPGPGRPVAVAFTGAEHDWAAVELGAWIARAGEAPLHLVGSAGHAPGPDASRLLASASLIVQRAVGITTSPLLVEPGTDALLNSADDAGLLVLGLPPDWRRRGLGTVRGEVTRRATTPVLIARKGLRPGGLAPAASLTRFTWTLRG